MPFPWAALGEGLQSQIHKIELYKPEIKLVSLQKSVTKILFLNSDVCFTLFQEENFETHKQ